MKIFIPILIILISLNIAAGQTVKIDTITISPFDKVYIYNSGTLLARNIIIMISGDGGWKYGVPEFSKEFSKMNSLVIGVDILKYYSYLRQLKVKCYRVSSDFLELATTIERKYNFPRYISPIVMGYSSGATLVYAILAQSRPGTFAGGISLGFCPDIELPEMFCQYNGLSEKEVVKGKKYLLQPDERIGIPWVVLQGKKDKICDFQAVSDFVQKTSGASLVALPEIAHDFSNWENFMSQWKASYIDMITKFNSTQLLNNRTSRIDDIPVIITREKPGSDGKTIALLFSGDGGWFGFEQSIANHLASYGISTIGVDTKKYFWSRKNPETTASEIVHLLKYYGEAWGKDQFMLIGYSQGAEIVPFVLNRFPEELKYKVISSVMLSPGTTTDFEVHISNMLGMGNKQNTYDVIAEISAIKMTSQICIFGENEKTKVPELLKDTNVETVVVPGDHHYKSNAALIVQKMKDYNAFK
jgi:type IV secretory pathway VirJ component